MDVLAKGVIRVMVLFVALLGYAELLSAQSTGCDNTSPGTLAPPSGLGDADTLLRESACTPGPMGNRIPLILIHGLDATSSISNPDLTVFQNLELFLTVDDSEFSKSYKIFTFHYLSNEYPVSQIGTALETWFDYFRESWDPYGEGDRPFDRNVVIIGHSLGGLVGRALMNENTIAAGALAGKAAGERVTRLITLATPHHGSGLANSTTLRLQGQPLAAWQTVLGALDAGWAVDCPNCVTNVALPNRGDLVADAYYATNIFTAAPALYAGPDVNTWLNSLPATYNSKVDAYYGTLANSGEVAIYGADAPSAISSQVAALAAQMGVTAAQPFGTGSLSTSQLGLFHQILQATSTILERVDQNSWANNITTVANDGVVPDFSGSFKGATIVKAVACEASDHMDMLDGTGGNCTDPTGSGLTASLFGVLDADLEALVSGAANNAGFSLAVAPSSASVTAGQSSTYVLSLTPVGGFSQQVSLLCNGAPQASTCAVSPATVPLDGVNVVKTTVTVTTTARTTPTFAGPFRRLVPPGGPRPPALAWVASFLLLSALSSLVALKRYRVGLRWAVLAAALLFAITWAACGSSAPTAPTVVTEGTPAGVYSLTVTGTYTNPATTLTRNISIGLQVN